MRFRLFPAFSNILSRSTRLVLQGTLALLLGAGLCACEPSGSGSARGAQQDPRRAVERDTPAEAGTSRAPRSPGDDAEQRAAQVVSKEGSQRTVVISSKTGRRRATVVISGDISVLGDIVRSSTRSGCIVIRSGRSSRGEEARKQIAEARKRVAEARKRVAEARKRVAEARKRVAEALAEASEETSFSQEGRQPRSRYRPAQLAYARDVFEDESHSYVSKWEKDLRVYVQGNATQRSLGALHEALRAASSRTEIGFSYVDERHRANVVVRFTTLAVVQSQCHKSNRCIGYARQIGQPSATATVYHEVGHLFGLHHAREASSSIMTPSAPPGQRFSKGDLRSLEMLYRSEVEPGMTVNEVINTLR